MTREEAIKVLNNHLEHWKRLVREKVCDENEGADTINAFEMAISALEQVPCETSTDEPMTMVYPTIFCDDAISREAVLDGVDAMYNNSWDIKDFRENVNLMLNKLPSVQPICENEREESVRGMQDDVISRKRNCIDCIHKSVCFRLDMRVDSDYAEKCGDFLTELPSVQPSRKGHWIDENQIWKRCSECKTLVRYNKSNFCPDCGADMRGDAE